MKILLDTHILIWSLTDSLPSKADDFIKNGDHTFFFSPISIMEIVIKSKKSRDGFIIKPSQYYNELLKAGYEELPVTSHHALMVETLPLIHNDPFDRILLAQAICEDISFLTSDSDIAKYSGSIIFVG